MIFRPPFFLPWFYPGLEWRIPTEEKELYLTFDDGPVPGPTEFVLDELQKFNAYATFFCIGDNVHKYPDLFQRVARAGHAIGNHTFHHLNGWNYSVDDYVHDTRQCEVEFQKHGFAGTAFSRGGELALFRPPYGRIKRSQVRALMGYKIMMWDVLSHDYASSFTPDQCLQGSVKATRPGSIIVFHDSLKAERNLTYALPKFLEHFSNLGYTFKAISNS